MKVVIIGDVHGRWDELNVVMARAMKKVPDLTAFVQVGDFGYAWPGGKPFALLRQYWEDEPMKLAGQKALYWLDGNHENHEQLELDRGAYQSNMIYVPRGGINHFYNDEFQSVKAMFFGGTTSPDFYARTPGVNWWPQESIQYSQVRKALEQEGPIDMIFSHDHPSAFPYKKYDNSYGAADQEFLEVLRSKFKPKFWVFGHHHDFKAGNTCDTQWMCAPIIDSRMAIVWDGYTLTPMKF
jgi:hypothetical protein